MCSMQHHEHSGCSYEHPRSQEVVVSVPVTTCHHIIVVILMKTGLT